MMDYTNINCTNKTYCDDFKNSKLSYSGYDMDIINKNYGQDRWNDYRKLTSYSDYKENKEKFGIEFRKQFEMLYQGRPREYYRERFNNNNKRQNLFTNDTKRFEAPCVAGPKSDSYDKSTLKAVFQKKAVWEKGTDEEKNLILLTFGKQNFPGCSPEAAWSLVGNEARATAAKNEPTMNLGFIDPPLNDFEYDGVTYKIDEINKENPLRNNYCSNSCEECTSKKCDTTECKNCKSDNKYDCDNCWIPGATVVHEFCHAMGMLHEHQNNMNETNEIKLSVGNVYNYYKKIGMTKEDAEFNVIKRFECKGDDCDYVGSDYDPDSIMLYHIPDEWVQNGDNPTKPNYKLSATDKNWLLKQYPKTENYPVIRVKLMDTDTPEWKMAWVIKNVKENIIPTAYIGFIFDFKGTEHRVEPSGIKWKKVKKGESGVTLKKSKFTNIIDHFSNMIEKFSADPVPEIPTTSNNKDSTNLFIMCALLGIIIGVLIFQWK